MAIIKSPIFKDITESEISEMTAAGFLRARKFRKNSFIYHVTDSVHEIGIVASGQVTIEYIDLWGNKAIMSDSDRMVIKGMMMWAAGENRPVKTA